ncbi:MAG: HAD family hydrolase [Candidatus Aenigmarchaeota archaeon]|nr:HAD family hydrolase [Candidatus Aenigmarchaeota archaeon]
MIRAVFFDADGTLYRINKKRAYDELFKFLEDRIKLDRKLIEDKWNELKNEIMNSQARWDPEKRKREYLLRKLLEYFNVENIELIIKQSLELFWYIVLLEMEAMPYAKEVLEDLSNRYILVVTSEEFENILKKKLDAVLGDWKKYFKFLITPDETKIMKPSKRFYEFSMKKLDLKSNEVVVIGNSWEKDLKPAKEIGIKTILLNIRKEGEPDFQIKSLKELKDILKQIDIQY